MDKITRRKFLTLISSVAVVGAGATITKLPQQEKPKEPVSLAFTITAQPKGGK
jgi:hypothetical protein